MKLRRGREAASQPDHQREAERRALRELEAVPRRGLLDGRAEVPCGRREPSKTRHTRGYERNRSFLEEFHAERDAFDRRAAVLLRRSRGHGRTDIAADQPAGEPNDARPAWAPMFAGPWDDAIAVLSLGDDGKTAALCRENIGACVWADDLRRQGWCADRILRVLLIRPEGGLRVHRSERVAITVRRGRR